MCVANHSSNSWINDSNTSQTASLKCIATTKNDDKWGDSS